MKKLYISLFLLILATIFVGSISPVHAAAACDNNIIISAFREGEKAVNEALGQEKTQANALDTVNVFGIARAAAGVVITTGDLGVCPTASLMEFTAQNKDVNGGLAMQVSDGMVSAMLNAPTQSIGGFYANMLLPEEITQNTAYAANCDDAGLATKAPACASASTFWSDYGISNLWGVSFTLAMLLVVLVLLISGFMIMFRSRIGGQAVVTVSMALQNVILGAVMALASFAIGVFFVNLSKALMIVIANLYITLLWGNFGDNPISQWVSELLGANLATTYLNDPLGLFVKFIAMLLGADLANFNSTSSFFGTAASNGILDNIKTIFSNGIRSIFFSSTFAATPVYLLVRLLMVGALLIASIRIWWVAVKTYITMAIDVVIAPLLFVVSAIPSKSTAVKDWLLRMLRNSLTVPMMFALVNATVYIVVKTAIAQGQDGGVFSDPVEAVTGGAFPRGTGGLLVSLVQPHAIIALVLLNMVPSIPSLMADLFSGKGSGAMDKVNEATMKQLQKIPVAGSIFS